MRYSVDWEDEAANVAPEERATVADLRLWLGNQNVSMHLKGDESIDHLTLPLYSLADGLSHEWWSLFGGRDRELMLINHRMGFAVPDIRLKFDGATFEISAYQKIYQNPDIRFWAGPTEVMNRAQAEASLTNFVNEVLERLELKGVESTSAALRWARVMASREKPEEAAFCESAGALGLDPYQIDEQATVAIEKASCVFSGEPLTEFLAGSRPESRDTLLAWVENAGRRARYTARIAELADVTAQAARQSPSRGDDKSWSLGYRRARAVRSALGLKPTDRFQSFRPLAEKLGASRAFELAPRVDGIRALRATHGNEERIHMRTHGNSAEARVWHLFSFARAVGDAACFPEPSTAPVNELHTATRQAAGRAFAAEFLAPVDEVEAMWRDGRDSYSIAEEFTVSPTVIEHQIENAARIRTAIG